MSAAPEIKHSYSNRAQQRMLDTVRLLLKNAVNGLTQNDVVAELGSAKATTFRDFANLEHSGIARLGPDKRWRPDPKFIDLLFRQQGKKQPAKKCSGKCGGCKSRAKAGSSNKPAAAISIVK